MNFNMKIVITCILSICLQLMSCIEKPTDVDFNHLPADSYSSIPILEKTIADTSGVYWGIQGPYLISLSVDRDNKVKENAYRNIGYKISYNQLIPNDYGLTIVKTDSQLMYVESKNDSIIVSNVTACSSSMENNEICTVDNSGILWFIKSINRTEWLFNWSKRGLDSIQLGDYFFQRWDMNVAVNDQNVTVLFKQWNSSQTATRIDYNKKTGSLTKRYYSLNFGDFNIQSIAYIDTTLFAVIEAYDGTSIKSIKSNKDSLVADSQLLTTLSDSTIYLKCSLHNCRMLYNDYLKSFWLTDGNWIGKIYSDSISEMNAALYADWSNIFTSKDKLYMYCDKTGKIIRLDTLRGFKSRAY